MTLNRLTAIAFRWSIPAVFAFWVFAPSAQAQSGAATAINGVYNGHYTCAQGPRTPKLSLLASGNGLLTGVFTLYVPPTSHTLAFGYSWSGTFDAASGKFKLNPIKWETPPPGNYVMAGMDGAFDSSTGRVAGKITYEGCGALQARRAQAESANIATVIAPQKAALAARPVPQTAAATAQTPAPSITGVYRGTCTCARGAVNLKLSLIAAPDGSITGFLIFDLPSDLGSRSPYGLNGRYAWAPRPFLLTPVAWGTPDPPDYSMARLNGANVPGSDVISGRVVSSSCSDFYATRDKAESPTSIAMAAQREPATATNGLVRKSKAYWDAYRTDIIRQVFDGGFGSDADSDAQFRILFTSYVEMFSKSCRAYLPAHHEAVTIPQVTAKRNRYGNVVSQQRGQSATVEVDSRFAPNYREYGESLTSSRQGLAGAVGTMSGRVSPSANLAPGLDMDKFFERETCQSAAMRQLGENLLRAATGEPSLQDVGATIVGASAETDKSLPQVRFARFVDGCNAFYHDPANSKYSVSHAGDWCKCLSEQYRNVMTPDDEYFYANDYGHRFWGEIAQPKAHSTDPAWPRLHPAVDKCASETN